MLGLYVHVPFCIRKCPYCDFYSVKHEKALEDEYINSLIFDIERYRGKGFVADTLYFGGGTPILLSDENMNAVIYAAKEIFSLDESSEITLEANPNSTDFEKLVKLKQGGINRISFGMQSANEEELKALGRLHNKAQAIDAVNMAFSAGIKNISVDIMLGTPFQTQKSVLDTIEVITSLPISHISAYMLKVEEATPYYNSDILKFCADEDELAQIYLTAVNALEEKGFLQYEISNFAKKGFESRHNLKYWQCEEYLGFGASAHSFLGKVRYCNKNSVTEYIENRGQNPEITENNAGGLDEYVIMGLRLKKGIDFLQLSKLGISDLAGFINTAKTFCESGLGIITSNNFALTKTGFLLSNSIIVKLLEYI